MPKLSPNTVKINKKLLTDKAQRAVLKSPEGAKLRNRLADEFRRQVFLPTVDNYYKDMVSILAEFTQNFSQHGGASWTSNYNAKSRFTAGVYSVKHKRWHPLNAQYLARKPGSKDFLTLTGTFRNQATTVWFKRLPASNSFRLNRMGKVSVSGNKLKFGVSASTRNKLGPSGISDYLNTAFTQGQLDSSLLDSAGDRNAGILVMFETGYKYSLKHKAVKYDRKAHRRIFGNIARSVGVQMRQHLR